MQKNKLFSTKTLVTLGLLTAISIVLTRLLIIYITPSVRISFGNIPIILAGVLFGPIAGALTGFVADFIGAVALSGFGWYPPLALTSVLMGIIPAILRKIFLKKMSYVGSIAVVLPANILGTMIWSTFCLHWLNKVPLLPLFAIRIPLYIGIAVLEALVIFLLGKSGLFKMFGYSVSNGISGGISDELSGDSRIHS